MAGDLFEDLPPPNASANTGTAGTSSSSSSAAATATTVEASPAAPPPPKPALKSALKRPKPPQDTPPETSASGKRLRFKTTTDASETQVIEAMQKISSHIKNLSKFGKASKLAIQLIEAGSVKPSTSDHFFAILEAAMSSSTTCNEPSVRADYHALFTASQDVVECLSKKQQNSLAVWTIRAVVANDLFTDDSFVDLGLGHWTVVGGIFIKIIRTPIFLRSTMRDLPAFLQALLRNLKQFSKATGKVKEGISNLPIATKDDDIEEATALEDETLPANANGPTNKGQPRPENEISNKEEQDPFGLDALIPSTSKKDDKAKVVKEKKEADEAKSFLKSKREAWISCLEIAAKRYKTPWCQTAIDILVKHAFDNVSRFTSKQREAIEKLWVSVREQQVRRKQGKSVSGKLDVNGFEYLQQKYANEKISIRHSVGGSGDRRCTQWLG